MALLSARRSPSIKRLMEIKDVTFEDAEKIKKIWATTHSRDSALTEINKLIRTHGREYLGVHRRRKEHVYYLNAGDTYATTILQIGPQLLVDCWGDYMEKKKIIGVLY